MGKAAAVLLYDPGRGVVTLVKQFRAGAYLSDGALVDDRGLRRDAGRRSRPTSAPSAKRSRRQASRSPTPVHAFDAYMSPGGMTEKIACFVAPYGEADRVGRAAA